MSRNPYAHNPNPAQAQQYSDFGQDRLPPQRTSIMAILSLVLGIVCVPGFGILGLIFGIAAIIGIKSSRGRVGGGGIATAGIIFSLLACLMWVGLGIGFVQLLTGFGKQSADLIGDVQRSDVDGVREYFDPAVREQITPEVLAAFIAATEAESGKYVASPNGVAQFLGWLSDLEKPFDHVQDQKLADNGFAFPLQFDNGPALIVLKAEEFTLGDYFKGHVQNVGIIDNDMNIVWLLPENP